MYSATPRQTRFSATNWNFCCVRSTLPLSENRANCVCTPAIDFSGLIMAMPVNMMVKMLIPLPVIHSMRPARARAGVSAGAGGRRVATHRSS